MRIFLISFILLMSACQSSTPSDTKKEIEIFTWWTSGSEAAALESIITAYTSQHPDVDVINASIAGGGGSAARPVLQTRLIGGNPPDTWQTHHGAELLGQYVTPGFASSLKDLYESEGWYDLFSPSLIDMVSKDGHPYLVVLNLHRSNTLWYNVHLLSQHQISIDKSLTIERLFEILDQLEDAGVTPMCMGDTGIWATGIMFENTLLGTLGADQYLGLWDGTISFTDPHVIKAIRIYGRLLDYLNEDHAALSWDQAADKLANGECTFYSMGDWAYGEFIRDGLQENIDFGWVAHPGTDGAHLMVTDGFTLASNAPHREETMNMLRIMGDRVVQENFNLLKGSICARNDCDRSRFGPYLQWAMDEYADGVAVPSVIHGSATPADFQQALNDALTDFVVRRDEDVFAQTLAREARTSGFGQ